MQGAVEEDNRVNVADKCIVGKLLSKGPVKQYSNNTKRETKESRRICAADTPHPLGTNCSPKHSSSEECIRTGAVEAEWRILGANVWQMNLELDNADIDKSRDQSRHHLSEESEARCNFDVVSEFEVVAKGQGMSTCDITIGLEETHCQCVAFNKGAANEFREDVKGDLDTGHRIDNANRDDKDEAHNDTVEHHSNRSIRRVGSNSCTTNGDGKDERAHVPPLRNFLVRLHQAVMNIEDATLFHLLFLGRAEAVDEIAKVHHDLSAVEKCSMSNDSSVSREEKHVNQCIRR